MQDDAIDTGSEKRDIVSRFRQILRDLPSLVKLIYRLARDARVSSADKALMAGILAYVFTPTDLLIDFIPVVGQIDDLLLVSLGLLRLVSRADEQVVREHWSGSGDIISLLHEIVDLAALYLPPNIYRILLGKVRDAGDV